MDDKQSIRALFVPRAVLKPMNEVADRAVPDGMIRSGYIAIHRFPYRVGRESRGTPEDGKFIRIERPRWFGRQANNDLYLMDPGPAVQVSREHFVIERTDEGGYRLVDCGSTCGTSVGEVRLSRSTGRTSVPLKDGDIVRVGTGESPYLYTFICDLDTGA